MFVGFAIIVIAVGWALSRFLNTHIESYVYIYKLDNGWPESEKDVFQAALRMVVVKDSR